jgi:hypothetical protein
MYEILLLSEKLLRNLLMRHTHGKWLSGDVMFVSHPSYSMQACMIIAAFGNSFFSSYSVSTLLALLGELDVLMSSWINVVQLPNSTNEMTDWCMFSCSLVPCRFGLHQDNNWNDSTADFFCASMFVVFRTTFVLQTSGTSGIPWGKAEQISIGVSLEKRQNA